MHDTLAYMSVPPAERKGQHGRLTFSIMYAFSENFILALSHDEVEPRFPNFLRAG